MTIALQDEQLTLNSSGELTALLCIGYTCEFKISNWASGLQFYIREGKDWIAEDIESGQLIDVNCSADNEIYNQFLQGIPVAVRKAVSPFLYNQFPLLYVVAQHKNLVDILLHSPNLCWLTVCFANERKWSIDDVAKILQLKRIEIVELLFNSKSKKLLTLIQKIKFLKGSRGEFEMLVRQLTSDEFISTFYHWSLVPVQAIHLVNKRPTFLRSKLLREELDVNKGWLGNGMKFNEIEILFDDLQRVCALLGKEITAKVWQNIESEAQLRHLHDKWVDRYNNSPEGILVANAEFEREMELNARRGLNNERQKSNDPFPLCPIGDLDNFIQIKTPLALLQEGKSMRHCVGAYSAILYDNNSFIYRLLEPERATVEIQLCDNKLNIKQFKLSCNRKPSSESYAVVYELIMRENKRLKNNE